MSLDANNAKGKKTTESKAREGESPRSGLSAASYLPGKTTFG